MTVEINEDKLIAKCSDGTVFLLQSETIRDDGTFHYILRRDVGSDRAVTDNGPDGSYRRSTAWGRLKRRALEWEREHRKRVIRLVQPGQEYMSVRSTSERRWEVRELDPGYTPIGRSRLWVLDPLGFDVQPAQSGGKFNGGVRTIRVAEEDLLNRKKWRRV